ncbi:MAG: hypothetical protein JSU81_08590 [Candidatus Coatesbacteria bacterium]|nr:MAG: hypothetical protein JSU81_08590 [Candidatus Coatesbacteria bacterium]
MTPRIFRTLLVALIFTVLCVPAAQAKSAKHVVAVFYFETEGGARSYLGPVVANYMMTALAYIGKYKVVDPEKVAKVMEGSGIEEGETLPTADAVAMAKKLGAVVACRGKVTKAKSGDKYTVTVDFISTATGGVISSTSANATGEANLSKAVDRIVGLTK